MNAKKIRRKKIRDTNWQQHQTYYNWGGFYLRVEWDRSLKLSVNMEGSTNKQLEFFFQFIISVCDLFIDISGFSWIWWNCNGTSWSIGRLFFTTPGRICCRLLTLFPAYQCAKGSKKELWILRHWRRIHSSFLPLSSLVLRIHSSSLPAIRPWLKVEWRVSLVFRCNQSHLGQTKHRLLNIHEPLNIT